MSTFNSGLMPFTHRIRSNRSANSSRVVTMSSELMSRPSKRLFVEMGWFRGSGPLSRYTRLSEQFVNFIGANAKPQGSL